MKHKIKKWIGKQAAALSFAMGNAQVNITEQYDDAKTIGMVQKKRQGSLMDDLLEGKLTDEVKSYRSRFWYVLSNTDTMILEKINDNGTVKIRNSDEVIPFKFTVKNDNVFDQNKGMFDETSNISLIYDFIPTYNLGKYITEVRAENFTSKKYNLIITVNLINGSMSDGVNKLDLLWTKNIQKICKNKDFTNPLLTMDLIKLTTPESKSFPGNITFDFSNPKVYDIVDGPNSIDIYIECELDSYTNPYDDYVLEKTVGDYHDHKPREKKYLKTGK